MVGKKKKGARENSLTVRLRMIDCRCPQEVPPSQTTQQNDEESGLIGDWEHGESTSQCIRKPSDEYEKNHLGVKMAQTVVKCKRQRVNSYAAVLRRTCEEEKKNHRDIELRASVYEVGR